MEVIVDGEPRPTEFVSRELIHATLLMSDIAVAGDLFIGVRNSNGDYANFVDLTITPGGPPP